MISKVKTQLRLLELPFSFLSELADEQRWVKFIVAVVHLRFSSLKDSFVDTNDSFRSSVTTGVPSLEVMEGHENESFLERHSDEQIWICLWNKLHS